MSPSAGGCSFKKARRLSVTCQARSARPVGSGEGVGVGVIGGGGSGVSYATTIGSGGTSVGAGVVAAGAAAGAQAQKAAPIKRKADSRATRLNNIPIPFPNNPGQFFGVIDDMAGNPCRPFRTLQLYHNDKMFVNPARAGFEKEFVTPRRIIFVQITR